MRIFLGITGASGAIYGGHILRGLTRAGCDVGLCLSGAGAQVVGHELFGLGPQPSLGIAEASERLAERFADPAGSVTVLDLYDLTSSFASGSSLSGGAIVAPCSMSTLAAVAHGTGGNLIHRAADVCLKERRRLVLVPRETPLSVVHLENMLSATRAGATVLPAMPGFYAAPRSLDDAVAFVAGKVLDQLGLAHELFPRWGATAGAK
ncbi:MAG: UbiX family flavin prenyltransferase [Actinobacteria bacterium]|nr:UbiX family flavin prenyltransferase [Actinomycetota bacterium]